MKRAFVFLAFAPAVLALPLAASAANVACYDWDCDDSTYLCTFDASCTENDGMLWRYVWDFGDGSGAILTGNPVIQHQYDGSDYHPDVKLNVVDYDQDPFEVTCEILIVNQVGPPRPTAGTCSQ